MNWFSARLLLRSRVSFGSSGPALLEQSIRLIQAKDEAEATDKAERLGKSEEVSYMNQDGAEVAWHFVKVLEVQDLCIEAIEDGAEVFSHLYYEATLRELQRKIEKRKMGRANLPEDEICEARDELWPGRFGGGGQ